MQGILQTRRATISDSSLSFQRLSINKMVNSICRHMKKLFLLIVFGAFLWLSGCTKKDENISFKDKILGNWKAVSEDGMQIAPEWGLTYEGSIKFYPDYSFAENVAPSADDNAIFKLGTWKLMNNNSSIIFYSVINDLGTIYRDTTEFNISIDSMGKLILKNDQNFIRHIKIE
jgi:hypothetical protein